MQINVGCFYLIKDTFFDIINDYLKKNKVYTIAIKDADCKNSRSKIENWI